jgi:chemotaxis family two-component system response regulator Rcp1
MRTAIRPTEVLSIDDNPADQGLLKLFFSSVYPPVKLIFVEDGKQALDYLKSRERQSKKRNPDLIISDLNMPNKDGREFLREIKNDPKLRTIPVIVFSSSNRETDIREAYELHANCYLVKPVDLDDFYQVMNVVEHFWVETVQLK